MSDEEASERYRTGTAHGDAGADAAVGGDTDRTDRHTPVEDEKLLARVPEWVVALGAGSLLTATLLTLAGSAFLWYSVSQGRFYGFEPYEVVLAAVQFTAVTAFQALGVRWARARVRWMWVMLAAIAGTLTFVALPFTGLALLCVGLGKYHFSLETPASVVRGEDG